MIIELYDDQRLLIDDIRHSMQRVKSTLVRAETGSGKTILASYVIHAARHKKTKSIFVVPRRTLLRQTSNTFDKYGIPHSFISAGKHYDPFAQTYIATAKTLVNRIEAGAVPDGISLVIVDECHYSTDQLGQILSCYEAKGAWTLGLTATPVRMDGRGMGQWFKNMVQGPDMRWLIDHKRLSDYRLFQPSTPDLSGIKIVAGDYAKGQLDEKMRSDRVLIGDAVRYYREHAMGKLNKVYCTSIEHSEQVAEAFRHGGIPAAAISGKTSDDELVATIRAFARREILALASCDLCTFGFDLSAASGMDVTIESMTDLQPTKSVAKQRQKTGRILRYKPDPALLFDHAGNCIDDRGNPVHGFPDDPIEWTLDDTRKGTGGGAERASPVRQCEKCFFCHAPAPQCPNCGHVYEVQSRQVEHVDGELCEMTKEQREAIRAKKVIDNKREQTDAKTLPELIALGRKRGYKNPSFWAKKIYDSRRG